MGKCALLIVDVFNTFAFEGAEPVIESAERVSETIAGLIDEAHRRDMPIVYVNDNYGNWQWERADLIRHMTAPENKGRAIARRLAPRDDDYLLFKPQFSAFYATNLPALLPRLGVTRLVVTGIAADICVLFTAADAHMREYDLWIPADAVAGTSDERIGWALGIMRDSMGAEVRSTAEVGLTEWCDRAG
jgi:nicotinamidase-related amidase